MKKPNREWTQEIPGRGMWTFREVSPRTLWRHYRGGPTSRRVDKIYGIYLPDRKLILFRRGMQPAGRRAVIAHELAHIFFPQASEERIDEYQTALNEAFFHA